jgi:hypothetical protein
MAKALNGAASDVEQLGERLRDLERRLSALERKLEKPSSAPSVLPSTTPAGSGTQTAAEDFSAEDIRSAAVVLGKAMLGIAGAYLLRAVAESRAVPQLLVLAVAVIYAGLWMVWAARSHAASRFAGNLYGLTAAVILSSLLWESTTRFRILPPSVTAAVLVAFFVLTLALARRRNLQVLPWVASLVTITTAWALIIATTELVPLAAALLAIALATELAVGLGQWLSSRAVPAIAMDLAAWLLIARISSEGLAARYPRVGSLTVAALCFALFAIYGSNIAVRSFRLRRRMTVFEIVQVMVALLLAAWGTLLAGHGVAKPWIGMVFLLLAATCYWGVLSRFAGEPHARNRLICAIWAAALVLVGSFLLWPANLRVVFLCLAALAAVVAYARTGRLSLGLHAEVYLAAAAAVSSLPNYVRNAFGGVVPGAPDWSVCVVAGSALACYGAGSWRREDHGKRRLLWLVPALLVGSAGAALAVAAMVWLAPTRGELSASRLSVVRTMVTCLLALCFGFGRWRWKRVELAWVAYCAVALGAVKLLFEDLRFGNASSLMISLLCYGLVLILLPRLVRQPS